MNTYVPLSLSSGAARNARRIGLGIMGLADVPLRCALWLGGIAGILQSGDGLSATAMKPAEMAEELGAFPAIKGSIYDPNNSPGGFYLSAL